MEQSARLIRAATLQLQPIYFRYHTDVELDAVVRVREPLVIAPLGPTSNRLEGIIALEALVVLYSLDTLLTPGLDGVHA